MKPRKDLSQEYMRGVMDAAECMKTAMDAAEHEHQGDMHMYAIEMGGIDWPKFIQSRLLGGYPKHTKTYYFDEEGKA